MRGISLYYVGRFEDGRQQFKAGDQVFANDVENAVWHFLCNVHVVGLDKAREAILKIGKDTRVPMMEVYDLYRGKAKPADVLAAAEAGNAPAELRKEQRFYAHLYLGLYYDATGDKAKALEHLTLAEGKYRIGHYMGDVAHVHAELLRKEARTERRLNHRARDTRKKTIRGDKCLHSDSRCLCASVVRFSIEHAACADGQWQFLLRRP